MQPFQIQQPGLWPLSIPKITTVMSKVHTRHFTALKRKLFCQLPPLLEIIQLWQYWWCLSYMYFSHVLTYVNQQHVRPILGNPNPIPSNTFVTYTPQQLMCRNFAPLGACIQQKTKTSARTTKDLGLENRIPYRTWSTKKETDQIHQEWCWNWV